MPAMRRGYLAVAWLVFLSTLAVYTLTVTTSIPFWDSGEYIATSYILGIPHPPGTPLYVLVGRLFAMLPFGNVHLMVNWLSSVASALTVLFTFLVTVRFVRLAQQRAHLAEERTPADEVIAWAAGAVAAFFLAFSNTFWVSAIEAEVYALSSMAQIACVYLALRWWEELANDGGDGRLLLAWYLMCLCIGIHLGTFLVAPAVILLALLVNPRSLFHWKFLTAAAALLAVGISVHFYLMLRASLNPGINEGDPETWDAMMYLLRREQYGSRPMFPRSADLWGFQVPMFWGYFMDQFRLWKAEHAFPAVLPLALGLYGAAMQFVREKKTFLVMLTLFGITSFGLIMYLNFTDREVRDRDYFFTSAFHFFAIWIGMGAGFVLELVRDALGGANAKAESSPLKVHPGLAAACVALVVVSWLPANTYWYTHDRTNFEVARDYAHNMLAPLAENGFVFTNGDNDTFPLWCLQEVEKYRKDVRVVNLSLLNTDWYVKQLRDEEPKVPMNVSDEDLRQIATRRYMFDPNGQPEQVSSWMVRNIVHANFTGGKAAKPAYLAVTVPDHQGLDPRLVLEGLVFRIEPDSVATRLDTLLTRKNMYEVFRYDGLYTKDGTYLDVPYKDENAYRLTQNYAAAHMQLAFRYRQDGRRAEAIAELERILRMYPKFPTARPALGMFLLEHGDTAKALVFFEQSKAITPNDKDLAYYHAVTLGLVGRIDESVTRFDDAIGLDPDDGQTYFAAYSLLEQAGRTTQAASVLRRWLARHPDDTQAAALRQSLEARAGLAPSAPLQGSIAPPGGPGAPGIVGGGQ